MPQTLEPLRGTPEPAPNRVRWTRSQCEAIQNAGVLAGQYELIDGEIISKMGQKPPHATTVGLLLPWLVEVFGPQYIRIQQSIGVGDADPDYNEPEPDFAVTREPVRAYARRHPGPNDLLLVGEVSDTTLRFDRMKKAALYALAGVQEYWVLDVNGRQLLVHRSPSPEGYQEITAYSTNEQVSPLARPDAAVRVADLLV